MSDERLVVIAEKLLERSREGEVDWSETVDENKFSASYPNYSVSVSKERRGHRFTAHNRHGTEVDSLQAQYDVEAHWHLLKELFELARHVGVKTDEVLDGLLDRLEKEEASI